MPNLPTHRPLLPLAACLVATALTTVVTVIPLSAAAKPPAQAGESQKKNSKLLHTAEETPVEADPTESGTDAGRIRLNYMRSSWKKVLDDLAKSMDKELVVDELPAKPFTRFDRKQHTPEEALKILNRELGPYGQKLMVKGDYLVMIGVRQTRTDYPPSVIRKSPPEDSGLVRDDSEPMEALPSRVQKKRTVAAEAVWPREEPEAAPERLPSRSRNAVRRASAEEEEEPGVRPVPRIRRVYAEETVDSEIEQTEIRLSARDSRSVAKIMYKAFKGNVEKLARGPAGLEGFSVYAPADETGGRRRLRFRVGIDEERNSLMIEATPQETEAAHKLIRALDKLPPGVDGAVKAVSSRHADGPMARSLQRGLDNLALAARLQRDDDPDAPNEARGDDLDDEPNLPRARRGDEGDEPRGSRSMGPGAVIGGIPGMPTQALQGSLKGEVSIEAVPDLNLFIIRGNERDVETVMQILKEIEKLSEASAPQVRLEMVEHLNSEALATLLTNVYDRITPSRRGTGNAQTAPSSVLILPVARPNALLIVAPQADLDAILKLLKELDVPSDPKTEYKVFRLKHAVPQQIVQQIRELYPVGQTATGAPGAGQPGGAGGANSTGIALSPRVTVVPDSRTNSVIVQARPRDMAEVASLIEKLDAQGSDSVNQLRIFPLTNAVSTELAATLQQAILSVLTPARAQNNQQFGGGQFGGGGGGGGQAQQIQNEDLREVKSSILEFLDAGGEKGRAMRSGIIADIRINADSRTNSVVVTAPPESMDLIETLINQLDRPSAAVAEIKVFPLTNADATGMVTLLERLFASQTQGQRAGGQGQGGLLGLQLTGADDASSSLVPLRFSVDSRTNSIIAIGGTEALRVVHAVLLSLDSSDVRQRQNRVYTLKNSPAADVAAAIQQFLTSRRQIEQQDPAVVSAFDQFEREVVVVPEPVGNKLLISATPRYFNDIIKMVQELDMMPKQCIIQALLVEVELATNDEWGVELGLQDSILFDRSLVTELVQISNTNTLQNGTQTTTQQIISQASTPGYLFNNQPFGNNTTPGIDTSRIGGQSLSDFALGRINGDLGYGGLVLAAGSESVSALLRALAARRRIDVLSRPQIQALDNQLAQIQVGQEIPRVTGFNINQNTGNATPIVTPRAVGIILEVIPRISPDGMVVMEVSARKDALNPKGIPLFTNPNGSVVESPIIDTTNALTSVIVRTGQTIVLGGMISTSQTREERKVPLLGDIPFIGQIFRSDFKATRRTELLIFLTPRIVRNEEDAEMIKEIETQRINFIECEAEALHGPLFGVPAEEFTGYDTTLELLPDATTTAPAVETAPYRDPGATQPRMVPPPPEPDDEISVPTTLMPPADSGTRRGGKPGARQGSAGAARSAMPARTDLQVLQANRVSEAGDQEFVDIELTPREDLESPANTERQAKSTSPAGKKSRTQTRSKSSL